MSSIDIVISPRERDLGGFTVGRILPYAKRRMVGPFIFFDEMGPAQFQPGTGIDVRPHPHIGLATVTYLFDGEMRHRDSLGYDQLIRPGDVNWMTAGRGIAHSERTDEGPRKTGQKMHGIQSWVALPEKDVECAPSFHHHPAATLPMIEEDGVVMRLIAGNAFGEQSPVKVFSAMFYLSVEAMAGKTIPLPDDHEERAIYIVDGELTIEGQSFAARNMIVFTKSATPEIKTARSSKMMMLGGAPLGKRLIWWNLVSTSQERIDRAKEDWLVSTENNFQGTPFSLPPDETEFIPLPDN